MFIMHSTIAGEIYSGLNSHYSTVERKVEEQLCWNTWVVLYSDLGSKVWALNYKEAR